MWMRVGVLGVVLSSVACGENVTPTAPTPTPAPKSPTSITLMASPPNSATGDIIVVATVQASDGTRLYAVRVYWESSSGEFAQESQLTGHDGAAQSWLHRALLPVTVRAGLLDGPEAEATVQPPYTPSPPVPVPPTYPPPPPESPVPEPPSLTLLISPNFAPLGTTIMLQAQMRGFMGASYQWDFDGNGTIEATTAAPTASVTNYYRWPGVYRARVTVDSRYTAVSNLLTIY